MNCKMPVPGNKWHHGGGLVDELIGVAVLFGYPIHSTSQSQIVWICKQIFPHLQAWLSFRTLWYDIVNFMYLVYSKQYRLWKEIEKKLITPPPSQTHTENPPQQPAKKIKIIPLMSSFITMAGPRGQKPSMAFPISHCPPFFPGSSCQSRALTSWATV